MFRMMLNAADRMVDKLKLRLSEKDRQIHDLQEEIKHLKQVIVDARMTESRLVATVEEKEARISLYQKKHSKEMEELKEHNCRLVRTIHDLEYSSSQNFKHVAKEQLKKMEQKIDMMSEDLAKVTHERDEMQRFIDTLPDGLRGAWSTYLMTKKDKERDND